MESLKHVILITLLGGMLPKEASAGCLTGWVPCEDSCFLIHCRDDATHRQAVRACENLGATLASLDTQAQNDFLFSASTCNNMWIGLEYRSTTGYTWMDGATYGYDNRGPGQPDEVVGGQSLCWEFYRHEGTMWSDDDCNHPYGFVCEKPVSQAGTADPCSPDPCVHGTCEPTGDETYICYCEAPWFGTNCDQTGSVECPAGWNAFQDNCYLIHCSHDKTHAQAVDACEAEGTELVSILSAEENEFIYQLVSYCTNVWIGLEYRSATGYSWRDGEEYCYDNRGPNQPDNVANGQSLCWEFYRYEGTMFSDDSCSSRYGYVCKKSGLLNPQVSTEGSSCTASSYEWNCGKITDGDLTTDWSHYGEGTSGWIEVTLSESATLVGIDLLQRCYWRDQLTTVTLSFDNDSQTETLTLNCRAEDTYDCDDVEVESFTFAARNAQTIRLTLGEPCAGGAVKGFREVWFYRQV